MILSSLLPIIILSVLFVKDESNSKKRIEPFQMMCSIDCSDTAIKKITPVDSLDRQPVFPGGNEAWLKFVKKNINMNIAVNNGAPTGTYKVKIEFIVNIDGSLSDFSPITNHGYGTEDEFIRILKLSPNWVPGIYKEKSVATNLNKTITFVVNNDVPSFIETRIRNGRNVKQFSNEDVFKLSPIYPFAGKIDMIYISKQKGNGEIIISDTTGKVLISKELKFQRLPIRLTCDITSLEIGMYVVTIIEFDAQIAKIYNLIKKN